MFDEKNFLNQKIQKNASSAPKSTFGPFLEIHLQSTKPQNRPKIKIFRRTFDEREQKRRKKKNGKKTPKEIEKKGYRGSLNG